jgi:hypothetical protein
MSRRFLMDKIKSFFKNLLAKIKGLFKKEEPKPINIVVPTVPPPSGTMPEWEKKLIEEDDRWDLTKKK